jgi:hypothetical protein
MTTSTWDLIEYIAWYLGASEATAWKGVTRKAAVGCGRSGGGGAR